MKFPLFEVYDVTLLCLKGRRLSLKINHTFFYFKIILPSLFICSVYLYLIYVHSGELAFFSSVEAE